MLKPTSADETTAALPESEWQRMTTQERTAHLAPLIGRLVRYMLRADAERGYRIFGPAFPGDWIVATLVKLVGGATGRRDAPCVRFYREDGGLLGMHPVVEFDDLYDVQLPPEPRSDYIDYGSANVYEAREVACPYCGGKLHLVQRATVEKVHEDKAHEEMAHEEMMREEIDM